MTEGHVSSKQDAPSSEDALPPLSETIQQPPLRRWDQIWESLLRLGLGEAAVRLGTAVASILLVLLVIWVMRSFYLKGDVTYERDKAVAAPLPTPWMRAAFWNAATTCG